MKKSLIAMGIALSIVVSGITLVTDRVKAADAIDWDNTNYDMKDYWSEVNQKAPVKKGYVFAGWYVEQDGVKVALREAELSDEKVAEIDAYAKFVPDSVLCIKTQVSATYEQDGKTRRSIRLLSTVDSTAYQEVGFMYALGTSTENKMPMEKVYTAVKKSKTDSNTIEPSIFSTVSQYFMAMDINKISETNWSNIAYARPYWITLDGTEVKGLARNNRVEDNDATGTEYESVPLNILSDGKTRVDIAVGKVVIDYSEYGLEIATDSNGKYLVDTGKVFQEMSYSVDEIEKTITFVGNGVTAKEQILADGLFANIRFVFNDSSIADIHNIKIQEKSFCEWNEKLLNKNALYVR